MRDNLDRIFELFPVLADRRAKTAGYLSGGEQQMLAMGRAMMSDPRFLLLDEPSLGLSPKLVEQVRDVIVAINGAGTGVLLVEQNATMALSIAEPRLRHGDRTHRPRQAGRARSCATTTSGSSTSASTPARTASRRSFRDVKHYRRKKRWSA